MPMHIAAVLITAVLMATSEKVWYDKVHNNTGDALKWFAAHLCGVHRPKKRCVYLKWAFNFGPLFHIFLF